MRLFILIILSGCLASFFFTKITSAEQPYQIAASKKYVNFRTNELTEKTKLLEEEIEKLKNNLSDLKNKLASYKTETDRELNELRELLENHANSSSETNIENTLSEEME